MCCVGMFTAGKHPFGYAPPTCRSLLTKETVLVDQTLEPARRLVTDAVSYKRHGNISGNWQMQGKYVYTSGRLMWAMCAVNE